MIKSDQPSCFKDLATVAVSCRQDGTMLDKTNSIHAPDVVKNRINFCAQAGWDYENTVYQLIEYGPQATYQKLTVVDKTHTTKHLSAVKADAIFSSTPGVGLFLPVADCIAAVFYDAKLNTLALVHIGRHASYAKLATSVVDHFKFSGSNAADLAVWFSPHAQKQSYKMEWFDKADDPDWQGYYEQKSDGVYLDLAGYNSALLQKQGVLASKIYTSTVDTMLDSNYFSHAQGDTSGRIAVLAILP